MQPIASISCLGNIGFEPPQVLTSLRAQQNDVTQCVRTAKQALSIWFHEDSMIISLRPEIIARISGLIQQIGNEYANSEVSRTIATVADVLLQAPFDKANSYIPRKCITPLPDKVKILVDAKRQLLYLLPKSKPGGTSGGIKHGRRLRVVAFAMQHLGSCFALSPRKDNPRSTMKFLSERAHEDIFHSEVQAYQPTRIADYDIEMANPGNGIKRLAFFEAYDCDLAMYLINNRVKLADMNFVQSLMLRLAQALQAVHSKNLALFDIKHRNILVRGENAEQVVFCDLEGVVNQNLPRSEAVIARHAVTFTYIAPEHILRILQSYAVIRPDLKPLIDAHKDKPCVNFVNDDLRVMDVFALGIVLISLVKNVDLCGKSVDKLVERYGTLLRFVPEKKPELHFPLSQEDLGRHLCHIASRMIDPNPKQRPTIDEVVAYIDKLQEGKQEITEATEEE